jgi:hypothetical protein
MVLLNLRITRAMSSLSKSRLIIYLLMRRQETVNKYFYLLTIQYIIDSTFYYLHWLFLKSLTTQIFLHLVGKSRENMIKYQPSLIATYT